MTIILKLIETCISINTANKSHRSRPSGGLIHYIDPVLFTAPPFTSSLWWRTPTGTRNWPTSDSQCTGPEPDSQTSAWDSPPWRCPRVGTGRRVCSAAPTPAILDGPSPPARPVAILRPGAPDWSCHSCSCCSATSPSTYRSASVEHGCCYRHRRWWSLQKSFITFLELGICM